MDLSHYLNILLFEPFFSLLQVASYPTCSSMHSEATCKSEKKFIQKLKSSSWCRP